MFDDHEGVHEGELKEEKNPPFMYFMLYHVMSLVGLEIDVCFLALDLVEIIFYQFEHKCPCNIYTRNM